MAYLGNSNLVQNFTPAVDYFNGNGSTTAFTLSRTVGSAFDIQAFIENVPQNPSTAFTVAGNIITFDSAPPSGTNNIYVRYTSPVTQLVKPAPGTVGPTEIASGTITPTAVSDQLNSSTGYFDLPAGTTAQRPSSPVGGMTRYNTTLNQFEFYQNGAWTQYTTTYTVEYLIVAGGAGGGGSTEGHQGGGGGAGGYRSSVIGESSGGGSSAESVYTLTSGISYTVTIGSGGAGSPIGSRGVSGGDSVFGSITSVGGGGGGAGSNGGTNRVGSSGGCGGGNGSSDQSPNGSAPSGTAGQGYAGGVGSTGPGWGGTGGGAGAAGTSNSSSFNSLAGGAGVASSITGSSVTRAVGGGVTGYNLSGNNGATNTGGGGWGGTTGTTTGYNGGSGLVVIRYSGAQRGNGGTVTSSGGYTIHTFTSSGTYTA